jgi:hypothetical protein
LRSDETTFHSVRNSDVRGPRDTCRVRIRLKNRRVGGRSDPLHPPVRLSPVREPGQRPGKAVRLHPVRPIRLPRRVLEGRVEFGQGADSEHAPVGTGIAVFRRGRARPSVVEHSEPVEGAHS